MSYVDLLGSHGSGVRPCAGRVVLCGLRTLAVIRLMAVLLAGQPTRYPNLRPAMA
jgi:hypothetical protein